MERRAVVFLSVALGVALLAIAFLLGRDSRAPRTADVAPPSSPMPAPPAESVREQATEPPYASDGSGPSATAETVPLPPSAAATAAAVTDAPTATPPPTNDAMRAEVARYFEDIGRIQAESKSWSGTPEAVAKALLEQTAKGNTEEFDALVASHRTLATRLQALDVPPPCEPHRRATAAVVHDSIELLEKLRSAIARSEMAGLESLGTAGQKIEHDAREVDRLADEIKKSYGL